MRTAQAGLPDSRQSHRAAWCAALLTISLAAAPPAAIAQSPSAEPLPRLSRLELDVRVDYESERIEGTATLTLLNASAAPLHRVPLLLNRLLRVEAVREDGERDLVHRQSIAAFAEVEKWQVNAVEVDLPEPLAPGDSVRLAVAYGGYLVGYTEVGMLYVRDHVERDFTILREDALAFPRIGVPSLQAMRAAPRARFDFEVSATVPEDLVVATGGEQISRTVSDGWATWRYRSREPAPYLIVAIAPYLVTEADGVRIYHFPADAEGAQTVLDASSRATARLQSIFGPLERPLALNVMEIPDGWGSQASLAGGIIQEAGAFNDRTKLVELYHELSHLWNAPDTDGPSPRWNEGLAMFLQDRLAREIDAWVGEAEAWKRTAARLLERCGEAQPCGRVPLRDYGRENLTDYSYSVGRLMFAALYDTLGEDAFDRALRSHFQAHQASGTTTDDMVRAFVEVGGSVAELIFADWLDSTAWLSRLRDSPSIQAMFESYRR